MDSLLLEIKRRKKEEKDHDDDHGHNNNDGCIVLEPTMYHDIPTNMTTHDPPSSSTSSPLPSPSPSSSSLSSPLYKYVSLFFKSLLQYISRIITLPFVTSKPTPTPTLPKALTKTPITTANRLGITIVCISDTHGQHRKLTMPPKADILIHAGDYTKFGNKGHAVDFNEWLGTLPYKTKIVVNGNHECNAEWHRTAKSLLSNATLLIDEGIEVEVECEAEAEVGAEAEAVDALINTADDKGYDDHKDNSNISNNNSNSNNKKKPIKIYGTQFYWPCMDKSIPSYFESINLKSIDILISHCPVEGYVDSNCGCPSLLRVIQEQMSTIQQEQQQQQQHQEKIVICGHMHAAQGIVKDKDLGVTFVNAANARGGIKGGHTVGRQPIVLTL